MNNLTGKEWLQYSFSIWKDIEKTNGERKQGKINKDIKILKKDEV